MTRGFTPKWTRETLIAAARRWHKVYGQPPKAEQWKRSGGDLHPTSNRVLQVFGSWNNMIAAAGLEPRDKHSHMMCLWTEEQLLERAQAWMDEYGQPPRFVDWFRADRLAWPSPSSATALFGGWNKMLSAAGLETTGQHPRVYWTKDRIAQALLDSLLQHGRWPHRREWSYAPEPGVRRPTSNTVLDLFGTWGAAKRYAGWDGRHPRARVEPHIEPLCVECGAELENTVEGCKTCHERHRGRSRRKAETAAVSTMRQAA